MARRRRIKETTTMKIMFCTRCRGATTHRWSVLESLQTEQICESCGQTTVVACPDEPLSDWQIDQIVDRVTKRRPHDR